LVQKYLEFGRKGNMRVRTRVGFLLAWKRWWIIVCDRWWYS
jgi:hypothetical protein